MRPIIPKSFIFLNLLLIFPLSVLAEGGRIKLTSALLGYWAGVTSVYSYMNYFQKKPERARKINPQEAQAQQERAERLDKLLRNYTSSF